MVPGSCYRSAGPNLDAGQTIKTGPVSANIASFRSKFCLFCFAFFFARNLIDTIKDRESSRSARCYCFPAGRVSKLITAGTIQRHQRSWRQRQKEGWRRIPTSAAWADGGQLPKTERANSWRHSDWARFDSLGTHSPSPIWWPQHHVIEEREGLQEEGGGWGGLAP